MTYSLRILITGATGCAGTFLSQLALAHAGRVFGFAHEGVFFPGVEGYIGDITHRQSVESVISEARPDWVFHLAALIPSAASAEADLLPEAMINVNVIGTFHVLDTVHRFAPDARVLVAGSSAVYGAPVSPDRPITEDAPLQPQSLYATTKATQDLMTAQFFDQYGLHTIRARTFNQTGPREPASQVCAHLARQIAYSEAGLQEPIIRLITLVPRRDFCDVRDIVNGYWAALEYGQPGQAYNVCSGRSVSIQRITEILRGLSTRSDLSFVETGPTPSTRAILNQVGDASRLQVCSGWQSTILLEQSLRDLLDEWRARVARGQEHL